eukprot:CAMPEP_0170486052 /NCGR_PEP_ID=MMETSP0208-20121228/5172_1 /TAXON_ID=197538 /ORGANISM="Strombidium inclinatum, Strain S3" /LENGTH=63 /DNA_ID=CAMNT_0010759885 /DNA_START=187 /DNA_END=378 /DNA_ORIENTATION=-
MDVRRSVKLSARDGQNDLNSSLERDAFVAKGVNSALSGDRGADRHMFNTFNPKAKGRRDHSVS